MAAIRGKVAEVISSQEIAINRGAESGIRQGASASLFRTIDIKDPETGEVLGTVEVKTLGMRVTLVEPKFCIATVIDKQDVSGSNMLMAAAFAGYKRVTTSKVTDSRTDVLVRPGDVVKIESSAD